MARFLDYSPLLIALLIVQAAVAGVGVNKIKCGAPAAGGVIKIRLDDADPQSDVEVNIPAGSTAAAKAGLIAGAVNAAAGFTAQVEGTTVVINGPAGKTEILSDATGEFTAGQKFASAELPVESGWFALPTTAVASGITGLGEPSEIQFGFGLQEDEEALIFGQRFALSENMTSLQILGQLDSFFTGAGLATAFSTYTVDGAEFTRLDVNLTENDHYTWALWGSTDTGLPWGGGYSNVPEPASLALFIGGILVYGRRR
ncbi:MAG: PEP-CTERM sorting domain-containing protein [Phycisphaerales bacterium]|nr:PEP-CTERM sorting domain-containing protein [Phycisphaerales bacterium]